MSKDPCKLAKYLVFRGSRYYPSGGWDDFLGNYTTLDKAKTAAEKDAHDQETYPWAHVVDTTTNKVVCYYDCDSVNDIIEWNDGDKWA